MFTCDGGQLVVGPGMAGALRLHQADGPSSSYHCSIVQQHNPQHHTTTTHSALTMAAYQNQDELAQLQELSNKWEPEATVLLLLDPQPCLAPLQSTH
jgi:hypothetical protein